MLPSLSFVVRAISNYSLAFVVVLRIGAGLLVLMNSSRFTIL